MMSNRVVDNSGVWLPGKIVVFDDEKKDVDDLINIFMKKGYCTIYLNTIPDDGIIFVNTRLVILDLDVNGDGNVDDDDFSLIVHLLNLINENTSLYFIAIWSKYLSGDEESEYNKYIEEIKQMYYETYEKDLTAIFITGLKKDNLTLLMEKIQSELKQNLVAQITFRWEQQLQKARDKAISSVYHKPTGFLYILKGLMKDFDDDLLTIERGLLELFNSILLRHILYDKKRPLFRDILENHKEEILQQTYDLNNQHYAKLYGLRAYYVPHEGEMPWTGDIYDIGNGKYAVLITPACDIVQSKFTRYNLLVARRIKLDNAKEDISEFQKDTGNKNNLIKLVEAIFKVSRKLPERYYVLYFVPVNNEEYMHLVVSFQEIISIKQSDLEKYTRICRIDTPYIRDLIQKYIALFGRVGLPEIPKSIRVQEKDSFSQNIQE